MMEIDIYEQLNEIKISKTLTFFRVAKKILIKINQMENDTLERFLDALHA